jgi:hypothetical protein
MHTSKSGHVRSAIERSWARKDKLIENAGIQNFIHPADTMEPFGDEQSKAEATEMFTRLLRLCLPTKAHGIHRTKVGHRRMCVLVYHLTPSFFDGMSKRDLAKHLGVSERAMRKEFDQIKSMIRTGKATR